MEDHKKELLKKYLQGTCSSEELDQLYQYLRTSPADEAFREVADQFWQQRPEERTLADERADAMLRNVFRPESGRSLSSYWYRIAAVLSGLALLLGTLYLGIIKNDQTVAYATQYGETQTIWLPDSSRVTLNANSSLVYRADVQHTREVWLDGEAFFEVKELKDSELSSRLVKFIVHTDNLDVAVLGTAFNVNERRGTTRVILKHGKVRLATKHNEYMLMQPGELAELASQTKALTRRTVDPDDYTTWRENKLIFKRTPIKEVARILEDYYGVKVTLRGEGWDDRKITGSVPTHNQRVFLEVLTESMGIRIVQEGDRIVLKNGQQQDATE